MTTFFVNSLSFVLPTEEVLKPHTLANTSRVSVTATHLHMAVRRIEERERERKRRIPENDVTLGALKLTMSFALFLAKNLHLSIGKEFCTFRCQKLHLCFSSLEWR